LIHSNNNPTRPARHAAARLCAGTRRAGYVGHVITLAANCGAMAGRSRTLPARVSILAQAAGARDHPHVAFYTIAQSHHHFGALPGKTWRFPAGDSRLKGPARSARPGGGPIAPMAMIEKYSADAVRYWAASTSFGKDSVINEDKIQAGAKLVTKLWNVAQFSQWFLATRRRKECPCCRAPGTVARRPMDSEPNTTTCRRATELYHDYEYATEKAKSKRSFGNI